MPEKQPALTALEREALKRDVLNREIQESLARLAPEMPEALNTPVEPMGLVDTLLSRAKESMVGGGRVAAMMKSFHVPKDAANMPLPGAQVGKITYAPDVMQERVGSGEIEDTLAHELTHVRQAREAAGSGLFDRVRAYLEHFKQGSLPYGQQPDELEAYQVEGDRAVKQGRPPGATPKFQLTPEDIATGRVMREKGSYYLPKEK